MEAITLDSLAQQYVKKINTIIEQLQNKVVIFDFDGTLTSFQYAENTLLPCLSEDLQTYSLVNNSYENASSLQTMQYIISQLDSNKIYVCTWSGVSSALRKQKNEFLKQYFPNILPKHVFHVADVLEKMKFLKMTHIDTEHDIVFIEDDVKTLLLAEETYTFVRGIHISSFLV